MQLNLGWGRRAQGDAVLLSKDASGGRGWLLRQGPPPFSEEGKKGEAGWWHISVDPLLGLCPPGHAKDCPGSPSIKEAAEQCLNRNVEADGQR